MTSQQKADELLRHWQLLWPLPAAERIKRIDDITKDYEYCETLQGVREAMKESA
jgi:hypothetical protein